MQKEYNVPINADGGRHAFFSHNPNTSPTKRKKGVGSAKKIMNLLVA